MMNLSNASVEMAAPDAAVHCPHPLGHAPVTFHLRASSPPYSAASKQHKRSYSLKQLAGNDRVVQSPSSLTSVEENTSKACLPEFPIRTGLPMYAVVFCFTPNP